MNIRKFLAATLVLSMASSVFATNYYWLKSGNEWGDWSDTDNWSLTSGGSPAGTIPGAGDFVASGNARYYISKDCSIGRFSTSYSSHYFKKPETDTSAGKYALTVTTQLGWGAYQHYYVNNGVSLVCPSTTPVNLFGSDANPGSFNVYDGGEILLYGAVSGLHANFTVHEGGRLVFDPASYSKSASAGLRNIETFSVNLGTLEFPNGIDCRGGAASKTNEVTLTSGLLVLGGNVDSAAQGYKFMLNGGKLQVTSNSVFCPLASLEFGKNKAVEIEVAANQGLASQNTVCGSGSSLEKSGNGALVLSSLPVTVSVTGGFVAAGGEDVGRMSLADGAVVLTADAENGLPCLDQVIVASGAKAKISLDKLSRLTEGTYTFVAAGNTLAASDYEITLDPAVTATATVNADGSVSVTITGIAVDANPYVWNPQTADAVWSADSAVWLSGGQQKAFADGHQASFNGTESVAVERVKVVGNPVPRKLVVTGSEDYTFSGDMIDTRFVEKSGTGTLAFDGNGFAGRHVVLAGGTLAFGGNAREFVADPVEVAVPADSTVAVAGTAGDSNGDPSLPPTRISLKLDLGENAALTLGSKGIVFTEGTVIDDDATLVIDIHSVPANVTFLKCDEAATLAKAKAKIAASLGSNGEIVDTVDGIAWKMQAVFESTTVRDLDNPAGWRIGVVPGADEHVTITGAGTHPVMTSDTTGFAGIVLTNEAKFTVASVRTVNALTLAAGTEFFVDVYTLAAGTVDTTGYAQTTESYLCDFPEGVNLTDVTSFACTMGGKNWKNKLQPSTHTYVTTNNNGTLTVQFQRFDDVYTKAVIVIFRQDGRKIYAKADKARYVRSDCLGQDILVAAGVGNATVVVDDNGNGYGAKDIALTYSVNRGGGTLTVAGPLTTTGTGVVTNEVADSNVLDLSGVTVASGATLVKTGLGTIIFGSEVSGNFEIAEGTVAFQPEVEYDLSQFTVAPGVAVKIQTGSGFETAVPVKDPTTGKTVFYGPGFYSGVGGWNDDANWLSGKPGASDIVRIGAGSSLTVDDATATMPAAFEVRDGAAMKVMAAVTLPEVRLAPTARFAVGDDETAVSVTMSAAPVGSFALVGEEVLAPSVVFTTNSTVTMTGNARFKNMRLTLCGTLTNSAAGVGDIRLGYATAGETSYFGLYADTAAVRTLSNQSNADGVRIGIMNPEAGGTVRPLGTLYCRRVSCSPSGWADWRNLYVGTENPTTVPFELVVDGPSSLFNLTWNGFFGGAAEVTFVNGAYLAMNSAMVGHSVGGLYLRAKAHLTFEGADTSLCYVQNNGAVRFEPEIDGFEQILFRNGARFIQHAQTGTSPAAKSVLAFEDGTLTVPNDYRQYDLLTGCKAATISADSWLTVRGEKTSQGSDWDRVVKFADIPLQGGGSLMVTNTAAGKLMGVTVLNGQNTATGLAMAAAQEGTYLHFNDGANWAGTVVANGHVSLTNRAAEAAATVTFGNLKLASGTFPLRTFRDGNGVLTVDTVNLTGTVVCDEGDTGCVRLVGEEVLPREPLALGRAPAGAWAKANVRNANGKRLVVFESEPDAQGRVTVSVKRPTGLIISFR